MNMLDTLELRNAQGWDRMVLLAAKCESRIVDHGHFDGDDAPLAACAASMDGCELVAVQRVELPKAFDLVPDGTPADEAVRSVLVALGGGRFVSQGRLV